MKKILYALSLLVLTSFQVNACQPTEFPESEEVELDFGNHQPYAPEQHVDTAWNAPCYLLTRGDHRVIVFGTIHTYSHLVIPEGLKEAVLSSDVLFKEITDEDVEDENRDTAAIKEKLRGELLEKIFITEEPEFDWTEQVPVDKKPGLESVTSFLRTVLSGPNTSTLSARLEEHGLKSINPRKLLQFIKFFDEAFSITSPPYGLSGWVDGGMDSWFEQQYTDQEKRVLPLEDHLDRLEIDLDHKDPFESSPILEETLKDVLDSIVKFTLLAKIKIGPDGELRCEIDRDKRTVPATTHTYIAGDGCLYFGNKVTGSDESETLIERNQRWVKRLESFIRNPENPQNISLICGLSHLFGNNGMLRLLRERYFYVERVLPQGLVPNEEEVLYPVRSYGVMPHELISDEDYSNRRCMSRIIYNPETIVRHQVESELEGKRSFLRDHPEYSSPVLLRNIFLYEELLKHIDGDDVAQEEIRNGKVKSVVKVTEEINEFSASKLNGFVGYYFKSAQPVEEDRFTPMFDETIPLAQLRKKAGKSLMALRYKLSRQH